MTMNAALRVLGNAENTIQPVSAENSIPAVPTANSVQVSPTENSIQPVSTEDSVQAVPTDAISAISPAMIPSLSVDLGNPASEAGFNLQGWGDAQDAPVNPLVAPSGDTSKRFQLWHADNSLTFSSVVPGTTYTLTTEVDDAGCADDFQVLANGTLLLTYYGHRGADFVVAHQVTIPGDLVTSDQLIITFRNISGDACGLAAVYNVTLSG